MIRSSSEWIYSHSGAGDLANWIRENRYIHASFQVFHFSPPNLNFYSKFFFPSNKMFPSFKLSVDSLSCYSCGQKPSFLSLSEIHLEIDNLTLINWICWTNVSLFLNCLTKTILSMTSFDRRFAALVLTRKQKAIARPSVSFQQGGPGFQVRILLTCAVTAAVTLFVQPLEPICLD